MARTKAVIFSVNHTAMPLTLSSCTARKPRSPPETCIARTKLKDKA